MKRGIVVSDIHSGSIYGMLAPGFVTFEGLERKQNAGQRYTWDCWMDFCARAARFKPDFVIANGDMVDGSQRKNEGSELALPAWQDQRDNAIAVLRALRKATPGAKWYFTQGTPYHVGNFGAAEEDIAAALGATQYASVGTGKLCREILWLGMEGVVLEVAHHIAVSAGFYRLTALDREMQWSSMTGKDPTKGIPKVDLLIRSHVHHFSHGEHASKEGVTTPCWQLQTRYMRKNSTVRMLPDIGGLMIEIDGKAKLRRRDSMPRAKRTICIAPGDGDAIIRPTVPPSVMWDQLGEHAPRCPGPDMFTASEFAAHYGMGERAGRHKLEQLCKQGVVIRELQWRRNWYYKIAEGKL